MADILKVTMLPDGTMKVETDPVSPAQHVAAEQFLALTARLCGGESTRVRKGHAHTHTHAHNHAEAGHDHHHD